MRVKLADERMICNENRQRKHATKTWNGNICKGIIQCRIDINDQGVGFWVRVKLADERKICNENRQRNHATKIGNGNICEGIIQCRIDIND